MCVKWWSFADIAVGSADGVAIALAFICASSPSLERRCRVLLRGRLLSLREKYLNRRTRDWAAKPACQRYINTREKTASALRSQHLPTPVFPVKEMATFAYTHPPHPNNHPKLTSSPANPPSQQPPTPPSAPPTRQPSTTPCWPTTTAPKTSA